MPRSRRKRSDVQFCLDANFSIEAVLNVDNVVHVSQLPRFRSSRRGQSGAPDVEIAQWCRENDHVLVTQDADFTSRRQRAQAIHLTGVEVVFFTFELIGVDEHIQTISKRVPLWGEQISKYEYGSRVWIQSPKGKLRWQKDLQYLR